MKVRFIAMALSKIKINSRREFNGKFVIFLKQEVDEKIYVKEFGHRENKFFNVLSNAKKEKIINFNFFSPVESSVEICYFFCFNLNLSLMVIALNYVLNPSMNRTTTTYHQQYVSRE